MKKKITFIIAICFSFIALMVALNMNQVNAAPADTNSHINVQGIVTDNNGNALGNMSEYKVPVSISYINDGETTLLRKFDFQAGETVDLYQYETSAIKNKTCLISVPNNIKFKNWKIVANGTDLGQNPYEFTWEDGLKLDVKIYVENNEDSEMKISNILLDKDVCPQNPNWIQDYIKEEYQSYFNYSVKITKKSLRNVYIGEKSYTIPYNRNLDLLKEDPSFYEFNCTYQIDIYPINRLYVEKIESNFNGNTKILNKNSTYDFIVVLGDAKYNLDLYLSAMCNTISFDAQYYDEDDPEMTHAPEYHSFEIDLSNTISGINYFRLINDDDGNLTYAYVGTLPLPGNNKLPNAPEGWEKVVKVNNNKHTDVIVPIESGAQWKYIGKEDYQPGGLHGYVTSTGTIYRNSGVTVSLLYTNKYDVKTFNKTDVNGNPADASFEVYFHDKNKNKDSKYVYKHYDSKVIKGETYENVYEVVGSADLDDESSNSTIETKNGTFTLYYPLYYAYYGSYNSYDYRDGFGKTMIVGSNTANLTEKFRVKEVGASDGFVINPEIKEIKTSTKSDTNLNAPLKFTAIPWRESTRWDIDEIYSAINVYPAESEDSYTYVNKKKPTVQEILDEDGDYDGEFEFEVYDVETGELVGKVRAPSRKIVALEPKVTDSEGNTTGYLEDGKKYRVVKKEIEDIINYDVKTTKGETGEDNSKYVEFTFNGDLDDICDIVFYDKQIKKEEPEKEPEEEPKDEPKEDPTTEPEKEEPAEETKTEEQKEETTEKEKTPEEKAEQVQTGDVITTIFATLGIAIIGLMVTLKIKKNK